MLVTIVLTIIIVISMIAVNALYVAGEFSTVSARKSRLVQLAESGNRLAKMLLPVIDDHHRLDNYIAASQVGITLSSIVLGIYGQRQIAPLLEPVLINLPFIDTELAAGGVAAILVLAVLTTLQVVLGELVPKSLALQYPERVALFTAIPMRWSADIILRPLIILLNGSGTLVLRLLRVQQESGHKHVHSPEEIQLLIHQSHEGGLFDAEERELLDNAFRMGDLTITDIIVPRTRMTAASLTTSVPELLRLAASSDYTRIPIYENDIDHIVGFIHLKDLFRIYQTEGETGDVRKIVRKASFVPETLSVNDVWEMLNKQRAYMAIVIDEYGGTVGMVTREDLIEEVFGEVQDEFDKDEIPYIVHVKDHEYTVRGDTSIVHLNSELDLALPTETDFAHTVSGLILQELGRIPIVGDKVEIAGVSLQVQTVQNNAVGSLRIRPSTRGMGQGEE